MASTASSRSSRSAVVREGTGTVLPGGRKLIRPGLVLPPGLKIRHPALLAPKRFHSALREFLVVWDGSKGGAEREVLGNRISRLWIAFTYFHRLAKYAYGRNLRRAEMMTRTDVRLSCVVPGGRSVGFKTSILASALGVKRHLARLPTARCPDAAKPNRFVVEFNGRAIPNGMSLYDAGVRERATLVLASAGFENDGRDDDAPRPTLASYLDIIAPPGPRTPAALR